MKATSKSELPPGCADFLYADFPRVAKPRLAYWLKRNEPLGGIRTQLPPIPMANSTFDLSLIDSRLSMVSQIPVISSLCLYREYNFAGGGKGKGDGEEGKEGEDEKNKEGKEGEGDGEGGEKDEEARKKKEEEGKKTEDRISDLVKKAKSESDRANAAEKRVKELEAEQKKREEEELAKKGEHEELAKTREQERDAAVAEKENAETSLGEHDAAIKEHVELTLGSIEEEEKKKSAQTILEGLSALDQFRKLSEVLNLIGHSSSKGFGSSTPAGTKETGSTEKEQKQNRFDELVTKEGKGETLTAKERKEKYDLMNELSTWDK